MFADDQSFRQDEPRRTKGVEPAWSDAQTLMISLRRRRQLNCMTLKETCADTSKIVCN
jgi:hypothetical protein